MERFPEIGLEDPYWNCEGLLARVCGQQKSVVLVDRES